MISKRSLYITLASLFVAGVMLNYHNNITGIVLYSLYFQFIAKYLRDIARDFFPPVEDETEFVETIFGPCDRRYIGGNQFQDTKKWSRLMSEAVKGDYNKGEENE